MYHSLIGIDLPDQFAQVTGDFDLHPKAVDRWRRELPLASLGATARALHHALDDTNRTTYPPESRLGFLAVVKPVLGDLSDQLLRRIAVEEFPLPPRALLTARLLIDLQREMALGYVNAADALARQRQPPAEPLAFALLHALREFGKLLVLLYEARLPGSAEAWQAIHRIFTFAHEQGLAEYRPPTARRDVLNSYKRILLLGAADPLRLRQTEIASLYQQLDDYAEHAVLEAAGTPLSAATVAFVVDTSGDREPVRRELLDADVLAQTERRRLLLIEPLLPLLQRDTRSGSAALRGLAEYWQRPVTRSARVAERRRFELLFGLTDIHTALLDREEVQEALLPLLNTTRFSGWPAGTLARRGQDPVAGAVMNIQFSALTPVSAEPPLPQHWDSLDLSSDGVRLARPREPGVTLRVGEPLALREAGGSGSYRIAVVRWFRDGADDTLETGVQLLGAAPTAVAVKGARGEPQRGLLFTAWGPSQEPLLLLPGMLFQSNQEVQLFDASGEHVAHLGSLVEEMPGHALFSFGQQSRPVREECDGKQESDSYEQLWERI